MVEAKGTFQQSKRQHEDNDGISHVPNTLLSTELSFQVYQPPERLDARIGHAAEPMVKMTGQGVDAPVLRSSNFSKTVH